MAAHRTITPPVLYFGTPVTVVSTLNADGTTNLAPISSYWALGDLLVLGFGSNGHSVANLRRTPELVLGFPDDTLWQPISRLGQLTGADPVPAGKPEDTWFEADKFAAVGWHPLASTTVRPRRVAELPAHVEARVTSIHDEPDDTTVVLARAAAVHVDDDLTVKGTSYVDPLAWRPLIYSFRHYFGLSERVGIPPWA